MSRLAFVLASALLVTGCSSLNPNDHTHPGQVALGADGYTVTAEFADMQNVVPNSTVQLDNVVVGTVTKIRVEDWTARVTMRLLKSVRLSSNAEFRIGQKTLLGAQYIEVDDAGPPAGRLAGGASIPLEATGSYPETEQVLASVSLLLNNGGLSQINTITSELNQAFAGRIPDTRTIITRLNRLLSTLDSHKADLVELLDLADSLTATVAAQDERVGRAVRSIGPGLAVVADERQELVEALVELGKLSRSAEKVVATSQKAALANLRHLKPVLRELAKSGSDLAESLNLLITVPFPIRTSTNAFRGDYFNMFATFDVSPQALSDAFLAAGLTTPSPTTAAGDKPKPGAAPPSATEPRANDAEPAPSAGGSTPTPKPAPRATACPLLKNILGGC